MKNELEEVSRACKVFNEGKGVTWYKQGSPEHIEREAVKRARAKAIGEALDAGFSEETVAEAAGLKSSTIKVILSEYRNDLYREQEDLKRHTANVLRHLMTPGTSVAFLPAGGKLIQLVTAGVGDYHILFEDGSQLVIDSPFKINDDVAMVEISGDIWIRANPEVDMWINGYRVGYTTQELLQRAQSYNSVPVVKARYAAEK